MNRSLTIIIGLFGCILTVVVVLLQLRLERKLVPSGVAQPVGNPELLSSQLTHAQHQIAALSSSLSNALRQIDSLEARQRESMSQPTVLPRSPRMTALQPLESPSSSRRAWSPEQVIGAPDTMQAGDQVTAWASRDPDGGPEWLKVDYERQVQVAEVRVRETYNPGAIVRLTIVLPDDRESLLWEGKEPPAQAPIDRPFTPAFGPVQGRSVKIYLDTKSVPGWNEIDAVELIGADGSRQWATNATASSTYADAAMPIFR